MKCLYVSYVRLIYNLFRITSCLWDSNVAGHGSMVGFISLSLYLLFATFVVINLVLHLVLVIFLLS